ncbi:MlaD family protein [Emcibacter sp. SYSU 3D8]|uniref:MlaD family protein n=1 Tax=Emcibacter sp. SYSU 3D8 TaxID=3133969 RepID=UPI0031FF1A21
METRRFNVLVGAAVLVLLTVAFVALFLVARADSRKAYTYYDIHFDRPISGLAKAAEVRFNGLLVGEVRTIAMDYSKAGRVVVTIRVLANTPVTTDTLATLEAMGFTGVSFVQLLSDGTDDKPGVPLTVADGEEYATIRTRAAAPGTTRSASEILASTLQALDAAAEYMSDENIVRLTETLEGIETASGEYVAQSGGYKQAIVDARNNMAELNRFAATWETASADELPATITSLREAAKDLEKLSADLDATVTEKRASLSGLSSGALADISAFSTEIRRAAAPFNTTMEHLEDDRIEMLFKPDPPVVDLPTP